MGLVGTIIGTLGTAFLAGRAAKQQYEVQARQAEANAQLQAAEAENAMLNAQKANKNAEETARVNAQNVEDDRRKKLLYINAQKANIGKSGLALTGSAASLVDQSREEIDYETEKNLVNGQQDVYKLFGVGTDYANQSQNYRWQEANLRKNASDYRAAGNRAFWNSMLGGAFSLAGNLYSSKSSAAIESGTNSASGAGQSWATTPSTVSGSIYRQPYSSKGWKL